MRAIVMIFALSFTIGGLSTAAASAQETPHYRRPALSLMAPADEYFGRLKESVIEIRNRLDALDQRTDDEMLEPETVHNLDDLQDAIRDWQHKYPRDPWLPGFLNRLVRDYQRAGAASTPEGLETIALLQTNYPDAQIPDVVANIVAPDPNDVEDSNDPNDVNDANDTDDDTAPAQTQDVSVEGVVVDADSGEPIVGAVVIVTSGNGAQEPAAAPFGTTADDGSFVVANLPATVLNITVQPPQDSGYAPYTLTVDGSAGDIDAGVIRLSGE